MAVAQPPPWNFQSADPSKPSMVPYAPDSVKWLVEEFLKARRIDNIAGNSFRELPHEVQLHVIARGDFKHSTNPSTALYSRIRDTEVGENHTLIDRVRGPMDGTRYLINLDKMVHFSQKWSLNADAQSKLISLSPDVQCAVMRDFCPPNHMLNVNGKFILFASSLNTAEREGHFNPTGKAIEEQPRRRWEDGCSDPVASNPPPPPPPPSYRPADADRYAKASSKEQSVLEAAAALEASLMRKSEPQEELPPVPDDWVLPPGWGWDGERPLPPVWEAPARLPPWVRQTGMQSQAFGRQRPGSVPAQYFGGSGPTPMPAPHSAGSGPTPMQAICAPPDNTGPQVPSASSGAAPSASRGAAPTSQEKDVSPSGEKVVRESEETPEQLGSSLAGRPSGSQEVEAESGQTGTQKGAAADRTAHDKSAPPPPPSEGEQPSRSEAPPPTRERQVRLGGSELEGAGIQVEAAGSSPSQPVQPLQGQKSLASEPAVGKPESDASAAPPQAEEESPEKVVRSTRDLPAAFVKRARTEPSQEVSPSEPPTNIPAAFRKLWSQRQGIPTAPSEAPPPLPPAEPAVAPQPLAPLADLPTLAPMDTCTLPPMNLSALAPLQLLPATVPALSSAPAVPLPALDLCMAPTLDLTAALPLRSVEPAVVLPTMAPPINLTALVTPGSVDATVPMPLLNLSAATPMDLPAAVPPRFPPRLASNTGESADERLAKLGLLSLTPSLTL